MKENVCIPLLQVRLHFATQVFGGPCEQTANMRKNTDTHTEQRTIIQLYHRASGRIKRSIKTRVPDKVKRKGRNNHHKGDPMLENKQALPSPSASLRTYTPWYLKSRILNRDQDGVRLDALTLHRDHMV